MPHVGYIWRDGYWCLPLYGHRFETGLLVFNTRCSHVFFCVGILEMVCALLQLVSLFPIINPYYHFTGSFDNPAVFAMFMSFCLPIGMYYVARSTAISRLVWGVSTFCIGSFLILSASRTGILAGMCSAFIMWMPKFGVIKDYWFNRKRIVLLWVALALLIGVLYFCKQDSADGRLLAWRVSANMIADRPFLGWGNNGFDAFYMPYQAIILCGILNLLFFCWQITFLIRLMNSCGLPFNMVLRA